jgi:hypothetical protein
MLNKTAKFTAVFFLFFSFSTSNSFAERWNAMNDPSIMAPDYVFNFYSLPTSGHLDSQPWSETYWASKKGSINIRWNQNEPEGFGYKSPTREEAKRMTRAQLSSLSPSEKYDLFMGHYDYPLKNEVKGIASPFAKWWSGLCDGWSLAALQYAEPQPVDRVNPDGIVIPFGSSDIKGLMSYAAARHFNVETHQVGGRCSGVGRILSNPSCADINAGSLHLVFTNQIGIRKQGFVSEIDPGNQIWNQATYAYDYQVLGSAKQEAGVAGVRIRANLYYADELEYSSWEPVVGTDKNMNGKLEMDYILDLDSSGNVIGGRFISDVHPDFVWLPTNHLEFKDYLDGINQLITSN